MIGADAVVGLPDDSEVVEYDLDSKVLNPKSLAIKRMFPTVLELWWCPVPLPIFTRIISCY